MQTGSFAYKQPGGQEWPRIAPVRLGLQETLLLRRFVDIWQIFFCSFTDLIGAISKSIYSSYLSVKKIILRNCICIDGKQTTAF
jgi:hypothetical protein